MKRTISILTGDEDYFCCFFLQISLIYLMTKETRGANQQLAKQNSIRRYMPNMGHTGSLSIYLPTILNIPCYLASLKQGALLFRTIDFFSINYLLLTFHWYQTEDFWSPWLDHRWHLIIKEAMSVEMALFHYVYVFKA